MEIDLLKLYGDVFGYVGLPFPLGDLSINLPNVKTIGEAIIGKSDMLGRAYFMPIQLNGKWLPNSPMMTLTAEKRIKNTSIAGGNGSIKELISIDDYKINIKGFAINKEENDYPYEEVELLKDLFELNKSLPILNDLCQIFEINNVVVTSLELPEMRGQSVQPFIMNLISDDDFDVIINE